MRNLTFTQQLIREGETIIAYCPELDVSSCGATPAQARDNLRAAIRLFMEEAFKMGTLAEDLVAPNIPRILQDVVGCSEDQMEMMAVRVRRHHPVERGRSQEFDVVAVCGKYVLINETKSNLNVESVNDFVTLMTQARGFFPEYADPRFVFIGAIASLYVDESVARYGQKRGVLVLGMGDDLMDVLNEPGFKPAEF